MIGCTGFPRALAVTAASLVILGLACGGGEKATPTPTPRAASTPPTAPAATPRAAAPTATPVPVPTATPRPAATPTPAAPKVGQKLKAVVATFAEEITDPSRTTFVNMGAYGLQMYDTLLWSDTEGKQVPGIAVSWEMAPDAKAWTYKLRQGMRFHSGEPVTAEDVKFSVEWLLRPLKPGEVTTSFIGPWRDSVGAVVAVSPDTVRFDLKQPWPLMPWATFPRQGQEAVVLPKRALEQVGEKAFFEKPIGSGPWRFVGREPGVRFRYEALPAHPFRDAPRFKELELLAAPEESTRVAMLKTGAADLAGISIETATTFKKGGEFQVLTIPDATSTWVQYHGWGDDRVKGKPLDSKKVRQALQLAVNRQEIVDTVLAGLAEVGRYSPQVTPGVYGYDPTVKPYPYDREGAKALLREAGYEKGFDMTLITYPFTVPHQRLAEAVAGYWNEVGVRARLRVVDLGIWVPWLRARPQSMELVGNMLVLTNPVYPTPLAVLNAVFHSTNVSQVLQSPQVDAWLAQLSAELDEARRVQLIRNIVNFGHEEAVQMPLSVAPSLWGAAPTIAGWRPYRAAFVAGVLETVAPR